MRARAMRIGATARAAGRTIGLAGAAAGLAMLLLAGEGAPLRAAEPGGTGAPAAETKLMIPYQAIGIGVTPLWLALDHGLFAKHGIEASTQYVAQSPTLVAAMLSGELPFVNSGQDAVIGADLNGGDIVILVSGVEKLFFAIDAVKDVKTPADLKGKKIGISQFGATTDFIARYVLRQAGLTPQDATILPMGSQANNLAAMQSGRIDAAVLAAPYTFEAEALGYNAVADMLDSDLYFYTSALLGKKSYIAAHPDVTTNVVRAYLAATAMVHKDKAAAIEAIRKYSKTTDPGILDKSYQLLVRALPKVPVPKASVIQAGFATHPKAAEKKADPAGMIDPSFVEKLQRDGFIDALYR